MSGPAADVLERVAAVLGNASASMVAVVSDAIVRSGSSPAMSLSAEEVGAMRQLINGSPSYVAAVGAARRPPQDDEWVKKHGVEGFKSPADMNRDALHIGEICKAAGIKVPANCPKDPQAFVGPECPCSVLRGLKPEDWFHMPGSPSWLKLEESQRRVKPVDKKDAGFYHKLGRCRTMRAKAHELAKADSSLQHLLKPLEKFCKDCLTVRG